MYEVPGASSEFNSDNYALSNRNKVFRLNGVKEISNPGCFAGYCNKNQVSVHSKTASGAQLYNTFHNPFPSANNKNDRSWNECYNKQSNKHTYPKNNTGPKSLFQNTNVCMSSDRSGRNYPRVLRNIEIASGYDTVGKNQRYVKRCGRPANSNGKVHYNSQKNTVFVQNASYENHANLIVTSNNSGERSITELIDTPQTPLYGDQHIQGNGIVKHCVNMNNGSNITKVPEKELKDGVDVNNVNCEIQHIGDKNKALLCKDNDKSKQTATCSDSTNASQRNQELTSSTNLLAKEILSGQSTSENKSVHKGEIGTGMVKDVEVINLDSDSGGESDTSIIEISVPPKPPAPVIALDSSEESEEQYLGNSELVMNVVPISVNTSSTNTASVSYSIETAGVAKTATCTSNTNSAIFTRGMASSAAVSVSTTTVIGAVSGAAMTVSNCVATSCVAANSVSDGDCSLPGASGMKKVHPGTKGGSSSKDVNVQTSKRKGKVKLRTYLKSRTWTRDMTNFYNRSWGGETFDHSAMQRRMSGNPGKWKILDIDRYGPIREYNPYSRVRCGNCNQYGHLTLNCPDPQKLASCFMCGKLGHTEYFCTNKICLKCGRLAAAYTKGCAHCRRPEHPSHCSRCKSTDHFVWQCPEAWRKFHCTTAAGASENVTADGGNATITEAIYKPSSKLMCCICGKRGHGAAQCSMLWPPRPRFRKKRNSNVIMAQEHAKYKKRKRKTKDTSFEESRMNESSGKKRRRLN